MTQKKIYQAPEVNVISLCLEGNVLTSSTTTGRSGGEGITWADEFDPGW
ncbi:MAG: hypothetical protein IJ495_07510 [Bacteroidales bacterium]|nr:hypothetical protein [Bacteroidales bacterium]